ncbi:type 1 phosphatidylinositol 4,5-bisphosphate 4-phosphatase-like isoform X2 [Haliotis rufescens]|uniref:type 1 phosphatidylinositol 4,5-bisphosphate 4-phosphatase-like isoform X2 n=1 Tax=Haliotis rufescens TaxID=6454 RepID=UPI00201F1D07|nr:type 1 phosphatidylinositol 4,5-bisphosphate 4-phosphatase-like isoform X2 [Haliotis rufescens]XP_048253438.1 type 1 phosphatidylinositol 4,5-bisphosphate 4-phosphatase-like isoform X2 [Haliotis rufescens]
MDNPGFGKSSEFLNEDGVVSVDEHVPGPVQAAASTEVTVPPIQPDELPPPYTPTPQGGLPMVNCKVCQAMINIEGKSHLHVVKCGVCQEATPIKAAPPGKKYVRCPCNCLLVCRSAAQRIACPRQNCRRVINLSGGLASVTVRSPGSGRICCAYCNQIFIFQVNSRLLARCPHCRKVSEVGSGYVRTRALICLIIGILLLGGGIGVTIGTYAIASDYGGIYVVWTGAFISGILLVIRALYYFSIRSSTVVGSA